MKLRNDVYSHFAAVEVCGDNDQAGNGVQLNPGASSAPSTVDAVGDDTNVGISLRSKGTGAAKVVANSQDRMFANAVAKTIVDGSATALFSVACPALSGVGGAGFFLVRASDGTEFQADAGMFTYSGEAKTTTVVGTVTYVTGNEAKAVSSGTLTLSFTADVSVANVLTIKVQPTGSLTETTPYTIEYTLFPIRGAVTIL